MKHPLSTTLLLVALFLAAQIVGLWLLRENIREVTMVDGAPVVQQGSTIVGERPHTQGAGSFLFIALGVLVGTALVFLLIRLGAFTLWKVWFLMAVWLSMSVAFGVLIPAAVAFGLALILALWKVYWPNPIVHNATEVFIYAGIAVLVAPLFDLRWAFALLFAISIYDMIAVWYSKHMITLAKAQTDRQLFAGLYVPKRLAPQKGTRKVPQELRDRTPTPPSGSGVAILGGGDIAFPLLFAGVVMRWLIEARAMTPDHAFLVALVVPVATAVALLALFTYAKKDRFYPAMPFLSAGAIIGFGIVWLL